MKTLQKAIVEHSKIHLASQKTIGFVRSLFTMGSMKTRTLLVIGALAVLIPAAVEAGAAPSLIGPDVPCVDKFRSGQITADCIPLYIRYLIQQVFTLTGAISLITIMVGGYQYALGQIAGGKEKGEATIRYGIIGMVVSALSFVIIDFIVSTIAFGA